MPEILNNAAFRALFDANVSFVWRVLRRHGVQEREIEDACQEVFLVVHRRLNEFEGRSAVRSWIYGIAVRVAQGFRRKGYRVRERLTDTQPEGELPAAQAQTAEQRQMLGMVDEALAQLSDDKREAFALYELEGMTMAEVALALGVPENTALYRFYGARDDIRRFVTRRAQQQPGSSHTYLKRATP
jgi:RNA polymerase sigma-70 factor, ECF subfamily